jgi:beta-N-acetylhexosaminidase
VNDLSCDEWDATYGYIYSEYIEAGALSRMVGHIMKSAYSHRLNPELCDEEIVPATLSKE